MSWEARLLSALGDLHEACNGLIAGKTERHLEWLDEAMEGFRDAYQAIADRADSKEWREHIRGVLRYIDGRHPLSESPIEQLLAASLYPSLDSRSDLSGYIIQQQVQIGAYRVDFLLTPRVEPKFPAMIIECDGKDFHAASETQVERDKIRDRRLQARGYLVLRFTGREIHADPALCASEALNALANNVARLVAVQFPGLGRSA